MYELLNSFIPFIAAVEGQRGFPKFHFYAIPLLIIASFALGWFIRTQYEKRKARQ